ncbi:hypothetical protein ACFSKM_05880 [Ancylobacter dichloromethanicus]
MTSDNLVRHRNNPNLAFWKMLKEGSDVFELTKAPPKVDYCGKRYVFNATPTDPGRKLQASAPCPDYTMPEGLAEAVAARQKEASTKIASAGALQPVAPVKTGKDGGMHKVFLAKLENPELSAPGSLPPVVKPPGSDYGVSTTEPAPAESIALATADTVSETASVPLPAPRPEDAPGGPRTAVAAAPSAGGFFDNLFSGLSPAPATPAPVETTSSVPAPTSAPTPTLAPARPDAAPADTEAKPAERTALPQVASLDAGSNGGFLDSLKKTGSAAARRRRPLPRKQSRTCRCRPRAHRCRARPLPGPPRPRPPCRHHRRQLPRPMLTRRSRRPCGLRWPPPAVNRFTAPCRRCQARPASWRRAASPRCSKADQGCVAVVGGFVSPAKHLTSEHAARRGRSAATPAQGPVPRHARATGGRAGGAGFMAPLRCGFRSSCLPRSRPSR